MKKHRKFVEVGRVDECASLHELFTNCLPAFGGAYLRRTYNILDRAIGAGCPLTIGIAGPVTVSGQHQAWLAADDEVIGFTIVDRRSSTTAEILWAAVHRDRRGTGIGTLLIEHVLNALAEDGVVLVEAKTLDRSAGYGPYESTRAFWERRGFVQIDRIDPMPGWQPGNPCALYVAALGVTR